MKSILALIGITCAMTLFGHTNNYVDVIAGISNQMTTSLSCRHDLTEVFASSGMTSNEFSLVLVGLTRRYILDAGENAAGREDLVDFLSDWGTTNAVETLEELFESRYVEAWTGLARINGLSTNMMERLTTNLTSRSVSGRETAYRALRNSALRYPVSSPERDMVKSYLRTQITADFGLAQTIDYMLLSLDPSYRDSADRLVDLRAALERGTGHPMFGRKQLKEEVERLASEFHEFP